MLPDWWKKMKRFHDPMMPEEAGNIKNCPAVRDILTQGIVIPAWTWIKFNQTKDGLIVTSGHDGHIEGWEVTGHHTQNQIENTSVTELLIGGAIKLNCPWLIKTEENIQTMFFVLNKKIGLLDYYLVLLEQMFIIILIFLWKYIQD